LANEIELNKIHKNAKNSSKNSLNRDGCIETKGFQLRGLKKTL